MKSSKSPGMLSVKSKKGLDYMDMILKTTDLCKNFKGQMAVNNVSLNIRRNSVYGLLGPNGAGKSTILKIQYSTFCLCFYCRYVCGLSIGSRAGFGSGSIH